MGFFDKFFLMRPTLFFPVWIMVMAGLSRANLLSTPELYWIWDFSWKMFFLMAGVTLLTGATFIQYQIENSKADEVNQKIEVLKKVDLPSEKLNKLINISIIAGLALISISFGYMAVFQRDVFHLMGIVWGLLVYFSWSFLSYYRKFQWSKKLIPGMLIHGFSGFALFMMGWNCSSPNLTEGILHSVPYLLAFIAVFLITSIPDIKGDKQIGKTTFAIQFGSRFTILLGALLILFSVLIGFILKDSIISSSSMISLPFFLVALVFSRFDHVLRAIRYPIFILAMFISVIYPWFFISIFIFYYFLKCYYYFQFEKDWPTFQVVTGD